MRLLLDTNAVSALMRGHPEVARLVRNAERLLLSTIVMGELQFGFRNGSRSEQNRARLDAFLANPYVEVLPVTLDTADRFGRTAAALRLAGTPIPSNDVWIAAHAMESGADLLSDDEHFARVQGLAWRRFGGRVGS